jgi:hypothetical protein
MLTPQVEDELRDEFARVGEHIDPPEDLTKRLIDHDYRLQSSRRILVPVAGAAAIVVAIALVVALTGPGTKPTLHPPGTALKSHLALRLVDEQVTLVSSGSLAAAGSISAISCSTAKDCVAVGTMTQHGAGLAATTADGGQNWTEVELPSGITSLSALSCSTATQCVAVGSRADGAAIIGSVNGGGTWASLSLPHAVNTLSAVSCATQVCWAVGSGDTGAALLRGSPTTPWEAGSIPAGVGTLSAVGCTADSASPTCMAVGSSGSAPAVIASLSGAPWADLSLPPDAQALGSAACTNTSVPLCTTLVQRDNYWVEASRYVETTGPTAGMWFVPEVAPNGATLPTGTVMGGVSTCVSVGGPSCTPSNASLVNTVTAVISSIGGGVDSGPVNESLTSGYISAEPDSSPTSAPGQVSPVWYMGVLANGFSANEVLTPSERMP